MRLLFAYMWGQPGKKLLFMGGEIGQWNEWSHDESVEWNLLDFIPHQGIQRWVRDLNRLYRDEPALYERDCDPAGFEWVDCSDWEESIVSFIRRGKTTSAVILAVFNFTPVPRHGYKIGAPTRWILGGDREQRCSRLRRERSGKLRWSPRPRKGLTTAVPLHWRSRYLLSERSFFAADRTARNNDGAPRSGKNSRTREPRRNTEGGSAAKSGFGVGQAMPGKSI